MAVQKRYADPAAHATANPDVRDLYQRDYYTWTGLQPRALRERQISGLDWENLAEEVEDLGKAERHRLESHLELLLMHLLKWVYQPKRCSRSWRYSIEEHRYRADRELRSNPGLKSSLSEILLETYDAARLSARRETTLELAKFPETCRWSVEDVMRNDFWPGGAPNEEEERRPRSLRRKR
jgi:hypothetical protein